MSGEKRIKEDNRPTQKRREEGSGGKKSWIKQTSWIEMTSIKLNLTEEKTRKGRSVDSVASVDAL